MACREVYVSKHAFISVHFDSIDYSARTLAVGCVRMLRQFPEGLVCSIEAFATPQVRDLRQMWDEEQQLLDEEELAAFEYVEEQEHRAQVQAAAHERGEAKAEKDSYG